MPTVSVNSISKSFGSVQALRDVSFDVYPGELFGLLAGRDDLRIGRFEVAEPSLDDIFISVVNGGWTQPEASHA